VCSKCSVTENHEHIYPRTMWEDTETLSLIINQQVAEILK
jgi:hypothetical protein